METGAANGKQHSVTIRSRGKSVQICDKFYNPEKNIKDYTYVCPYLDSERTVKVPTGERDPNQLCGLSMEKYYICNRGKEE